MGKKTEHLLIHNIAQAMIDHANSLEEVIEFERANQVLLKEIKQHAALQQIFDNPLIPGREKKQVFKILADKLNLPPFMLHFLSLLTDQNLLSIFPEMANIFYQKTLVLRNIVQAKTYTPKPLTPSTRAGIAALIEKNSDGTCQLEETIDPRLLGGFKVMWDYKLIDASITTVLGDIKQALKGATV